MNQAIEEQEEAEDFAYDWAREFLLESRENRETFYNDFFLQSDQVPDGFTAQYSDHWDSIIMLFANARNVTCAPFDEIFLDSFLKLKFEKYEEILQINTKE